MAGWNALDRMLSTRTVLALTAAALLLPGAAHAGTTTIGNDDTDCFGRATIEGDDPAEDPVGGHFWARRDVFSFNGSGCGIGAFLEGISLVLKTPFEIDSTPDIDDIDAGPDFLTLQDEMRALFPDFNESFGAGAVQEVSGDPLVGDEGAFVAAQVCIEIGTQASLSVTVETCLSGSDTGDFGLLDLFNIGGGYSVFTSDLGSGVFVCNTGECNVADVINIVTVATSNSTEAPLANGDLPISELVVGWQFATTVPEPSLLALVVPGLAAVAWRRRRSG